MSDSNETAGFVAPEPADLAPLFPGYDIQYLIAVGGMGAVYCAVQKSLDRTVALKILPMEFSQDAAFCAGFEAEAKAMARLNHPNLIGVYDFGEVNGMLYIIMEYVAGKSIYHSAYGKTIDPKEAIRLVTGVCNGLAHAHENGIIHRDIKPSNILLDAQAEPKIGDFGLASPMGRTVEEGEEIFGTPHYTAPEVVDSPRSVDYRADIFSVGVLLHELLTSKLPAEDPRSASAIAKCDSRFDAIIRKATMPIPSARYANAKEIADDLQAISATAIARPGSRVTSPVPMRGAAAVVRRPATSARGRVRPAPKKGSNSGVILLLIAAAVAAAGVYVMSSGKPREIPLESDVIVLPNSTGDSAKSKDPDGKVMDSDSSGSSRPEDSTAMVPEQAPEEDDSVLFPDMAPPGDATPDTGIPAPKSDVTAFFGRAKSIMQDKARVPVAAYRLGMKENFSGFEYSIKRTESKYKSGSGPESGILETAIAEWRAEGNLIPDELDSPLSDFPELEQVRAEYGLKESGVRDTYNQEISKLSSLYVLGLEKEMERQQANDDPGAVHLIKERIATTKADPDFFPSAILGLPPEKDADE